MAKKTPSNQDLERQIDHLDTKISKGFKEMRGYVDSKTQPIHDWITDHTAYERGLQDAKRKSGNGVIIPSEVWGVIKILVIIIATMLGLNYSGAISI